MVDGVVYARDGDGGATACAFGCAGTQASMLDVQTVCAAATGQAPPQELIVARRGLSRAQRRAARRAVMRAQSADDPAVARLAVAIARMKLRRRPSSSLTAFFALLVVAWLALAIGEFAAHHTIAGVAFAGAFLVGLWSLNRMRPNYRAAALTAERLNRGVLERAGTPYVDDPAYAEPFAPPAAAVALAAVVLFAFYDLVFGGVTDAVDGRSFDLRHAAGRGAVYAAFMTIANFTIQRRRTKRQSQRPIS